jgi:hypothetical protein
MRLLNRTALLLACCLAVSASSFAADTAAKASRPTGTWTRETGGPSISFDIKADTLTIRLKDGDQSLTISAAYSVADDTLFGVITRVERTGIEGGPNKGDLFGFTYKADKSTLNADFHGAVIPHTRTISQINTR